MNKTKYISQILSIIIFIMCFSSFSISASTSPINNCGIKVIEHDIIPFADVIVWKYMKINNKLYKRQYNTSIQQWVGNWILVK